VPGATRRWRLDVAYRGDPFRGFAAQPGEPTVAGALAGALATVLSLEVPPALVCAGRTDAGVHALGQVVHVDLPDPLRAGVPDDGDQLARSCTRLLAPDVVVRACAPAPDGFDARRSARWRAYRYLVHASPSPSPLLEGLAWHVARTLDVRAMGQAAYAVLGEHDFRALCRRQSGMDPDEPIVRRVLDANVGVADDAAGLAAPGELLRVDVRATSFCHQMVRSLVAVLVAVGARELSAADLVERLRTGSRGGLPAPAPPGGLCLLEVGYA
jgi:tRNA pseudouridine38-40 synthase